VRVTIEVPQKLSSTQKRILKEFEAAGNDGNYPKRRSLVDKLKSMMNM